MSNERPIKKPGRSGAAFRSGPMVENPGKMLGRLMGYIFKNYRIHIIVVVIGIVVSVLANVQGTMFMKTLIDQYIMPMLQSETPDFHPLAMAILRVACFYAIGVACTYKYNRLMIYVSQGTLRNLRNEMFERMETLPVKYFDTHAHGDIMSTYTKDDQPEYSTADFQCDYHCQCIGKYDYFECASYHRDSGHGWSDAGGK